MLWTRDLLPLRFLLALLVSVALIPCAVIPERINSPPDFYGHIRYQPLSFTLQDNQLVSETLISICGHYGYPVTLVGFSQDRNRQQLDVYITDFARAYYGHELNIGEAKILYDADDQIWEGKLHCRHTLRIHDVALYVPDAARYPDNAERWERNSEELAKLTAEEDAKLLGIPSRCSIAKPGVFAVGVASDNLKVVEEISSSDAELLAVLDRGKRYSKRFVMEFERTIYLSNHLFDSDTTAEILVSPIFAGLPKKTAEHYMNNVERYVIARAPTFFVVDIVRPLLQRPDVMWLKFPPGECGAGSVEGVVLDKDVISKDGQPDVVLAKMFLDDVLAKTFADSKKDERFHMESYVMDPVWMKFRVRLSGPAGLVTFTGDNFWKRLDMQVKFINLGEIALDISIPKAKRAYWNPRQRERFPNDADYIPYDDVDEELKRLAERIIMNAYIVARSKPDRL